MRTAATGLRFFCALCGSEIEEVDGVSIKFHEMSIKSQIVSIKSDKLSIKLNGSPPTTLGNKNVHRFCKGTATSGLRFFVGSGAT